MQLSTVQLQSLANGEPVRLSESGIECVVVRADVYERLKETIATDEWTTEEMLKVAERTFDDADSVDPIE